MTRIATLALLTIFVPLLVPPALAQTIQEEAQDAFFLEGDFEGAEERLLAAIQGATINDKEAKSDGSYSRDASPARTPN